MWCFASNSNSFCIHVIRNHMTHKFNVNIFENCHIYSHHYKVISENVLIVNHDDGFDEFRHLINEYLKEEPLEYLTCRESTDENFEFLRLFFSNDKIIDELLSLKTLSINIISESQLQFLILALQQIKSLVSVNVTINFSSIVNSKLIRSLVNEYLRRKDDVFFVSQYSDSTKYGDMMEILLKSEMLIDPDCSFSYLDLDLYRSLKRYENKSIGDIIENLDSRKNFVIVFCRVLSYGFLYFTDSYL